ncbi:MAG: 6-pyruvoyl trahydropterin synthase family protein [Candidatus Heimdallarchaeaceae archaeon]
MKIVKEIQWDMGHRITNHDSVCRNLHGHRYKAEICVEGKLVNTKGSSREGMVIDFGDVKKIAMKHIHDVLDHGFMVWKKDKLLVNFFKKNEGLKHIIVPFVPTSENIAAWIFLTLDKHLKDRFKTDLKLYSIKLWETPTSSALCTRKDIEK